MARKEFSQDVLDWIEARKRHHLSHAHVQMARELGMNPKKFGEIDNHREEPWKAPFPQFIKHLYFKAFGKERPEIVMSIEERTRAKEAKRATRKEGTAPCPRGRSWSPRGTRTINVCHQQR